MPDDDLLTTLKNKGDGSKGKPTLDNPIRASAGARVRTSYPKSRRAGQYVRTTATLLPEVLEELETIRQQISADAERELGIRSGVKLTDVIRMMVDAGIEQWKSGSLEVELEEKVIEPSVKVKGLRVR